MEAKKTQNNQSNLEEKKKKKLEESSSLTSGYATQLWSKQYDMGTKIEI